MKTAEEMDLMMLFVLTTTWVFVSLLSQTRLSSEVDRSVPVADGSDDVQPFLNHSIVEGYHRSSCMTQLPSVYQPSRRFLEQIQFRLELGAIAADSTRLARDGLRSPLHANTCCFSRVPLLG